MADENREQVVDGIVSEDVSSRGEIGPLKGSPLVYGISAGESSGFPYQRTARVYDPYCPWRDKIVCFVPEDDPAKNF